MFKLTSVAKAIQRERILGVVLKTVGDIAVPMELQTILRENLLVYDSGPGIPTNFLCSPVRQIWTFSSITQLGTLMAHQKVVPLYSIK